jgi:hypothetical protein
MRDLGVSLQEARSTPETFGSWFIRGTADGRPIRVVWDGREDVLAIQEPSIGGRSDDWGDRWVAGTKYARKPSELRDGLLSVLRR